MKQNKATWKILVIVSLIITAIAGMYWYENVQEEEENNEASLYSLPDSLLGKALTQEDSAFLHYQTEQTKSPSMDSLVLTVQNPTLPFKANLRIENDSVFVSLQDEQKKMGSVARKGLALKNNQRLLTAQLADLNRNDLPELYLFIQEKKGMKLIAFEVQGKNFKAFQLPPLMGRQTFGYAGQDSIYLNEDKIVRRFRFENAQFSEFPSGNRFCEYMLDPTLHFTLVKAVDFGF
jgi:hypothetical protein